MLDNQPPVSNEGSLSASLDTAYGNRLKSRNRERIQANVCYHLPGSSRYFHYPALTSANDASHEEKRVERLNGSFTVMIASMGKRLLCPNPIWTTCIVTFYCDFATWKCEFVHCISQQGHSSCSRGWCILHSFFFHSLISTRTISAVEYGPSIPTRHH